MIKLKMRFKSPAYVLMAATSLVLLVVNIYAAKTIDVVGSPFFFALAILVELILFVVLVHSVFIGLNRPRAIVRSLVGSAWKGVLSDPNIKQLRRTKSPVLRWLSRRLSPSEPFGLLLTATLLVAGLLLLGFVAILQDVVFKEALTQVDIRVINLVPSIRTSAQTSFFSFITFAANTQLLVVLTFTTAALLWRGRQRLLAGLLVGAYIVEESLSMLLKNVVGRMRPESALSLIREDSFSFPSGHVLRATLLFGLLAYLLYKSSKSTQTRLLVPVLYITTVFSVAMSRMYLGVHYPSDVLASALLGGSLLVLAVGGLEIASRFEIAGHAPLMLVNRRLFFVPLVMLVASLVGSPFFVRIRPVSIMPASSPLAAVDQSTIGKLPQYSETLTGAHMEPINFVYIGYEDQIDELFTAHGWYKSDPSTLRNTLTAIAVGFQGGQYLQAPVTPSYLLAKPQNLAFEKPTSLNALKQRHHTRLWRTDYALPDGRPIWVATASLDDGIQFVGPAKLPTHHIDPNIDAERAYIAESLDQPSTLLQVVGPQLGTNASGDSFFTDGKALVITLPYQAPQVP